MDILVNFSSFRYFLLHFLSTLNHPQYCSLATPFRNVIFLSHRTKDRGQTNSPELVFFKGVGANCDSRC